MNDLQILTKAHALIARGWVQGALSRFNPDEGGHSYCILGAIVATGGVVSLAQSENHSVFRKLVACLGRADSNLGGSTAASRLASFNDSRSRTQGKAEVLALVEQAIAVELRKEEPNPAQRAMQRAFDTDLISHEETDSGQRTIRSTGLFQLPKFNTIKVNFTDLLGAWNRRKSGSTRRESEGVAG